MNEKPRIGVFVCHCGLNIADVVNVKDVVEYAKTLPDVVFATDYLFMCSAPGQDLIKECVKSHNLNRVVVAACSPLMHEPTFRAVTGEAGLNPYVLEMANIREHCSWVHPKEKKEATEKAKALIRRAVAKARLLEPLERPAFKVKPQALVLGGGVAGLRAALDLAERGLEVYLVEKKPVIGGLAGRIGQLAQMPLKGIEIVNGLIKGLVDNDRIHIFSNTELESVHGSVGDFLIKVVKKPRYVDAKCNLCGKCEEVCPVEVPNEYEFGLNKRKAIYLPYKGAYPPFYTIDDKSCTRCGKCVEVCEVKAINLDAKEEKEEINVGAIVLATGYKPYEPSPEEYGYGTSRRIITLFQLNRMLDEDGPIGGELLLGGSNPKSIAFIMCVGSLGTTEHAHQYCSRMCCSSMIKSLLRIKEKYPEMDIFVLYKHMRTYGTDEELYWKAIENGTKYIRFEEPPVVKATEGSVQIDVFDTMIQERLVINVDGVVLVNGMEAGEDNRKLSAMLSLSLDQDNFFKEAHLKLRPVEALTDGVFLAGSVTGPKSIVESLTSGSAAAAKASALLSKEVIEVEPFIAQVNEELCSGCGVCAAMCVYGAITIKEDENKKRTSNVNISLCKGCGACVATCPSGAMQQKGFTDEQIRAEISAITS